MQKLIFLFILILLIIGPAGADGIDDPCRKSTEGKDFWFAFMESRNYHSTHYVEVTLTSPFTCNYELRIGKSDVVEESGTLLPDQPQQIRLKWQQVEATGSEKTQEKAIHLTSDSPMNVYALNFDNNSSDVALIFPTSALGKEYYAICYEPHIHEGAQGAYGNGRNSEFLIVATEDSTLVTIIPSMVTDLLQPAGVPFKLKLNKGEVYQVQSMNRSNLTGQGDLTGSNIQSDKPVAFFSGSLATTVPATSTVSAWDHLYEQIPPVQAWGNQFMAVPLKSRQWDTYRILAAYDNTTVKVGNDPYLLAKKGDFKEFMLEYRDPRIVESSKPILLVQYSNSQSVDLAFTNKNGDPFMIIVSPLTQTKQNVTFVAYSSTQITDRYFVNVIARDVSAPFITLDQVPVQFISLPNSGYSYAQISIKQGNHKLQTSMPDKGFIAYVYGFGGVESYGYGVGFNLDIQLNLGFNYELTDTLVICKGTEAKLEAGAYFDTYSWSNSETKPFIMVSEEALYKVTASTIAGCIKKDSLYLKVSDPKIDLGKVTSSCGPGKVILDAGKQIKTYQWQDGSTDRTFTVNKTGDYTVFGNNEFGCKASDTLHVDVFDVPNVKITGDTLHCDDFTSELHVDITNVDSLLWNYPGTAQWSCNSADLEFQNIKPDGVTLKANKPGLYKVNYILTTKDGCSDSDFFEVGFYEIPESDFEVYSPESTDKCSSYERIVKYTGKSGPTAKFNWDFGGLIVLETIAPNHFKISIGANKPNRTISLVVQEHGCTSPVFSKTIGVKPTFSFEADKVHGCDVLCVQFSSKVTIMDDVSFLWTFGDGSESNLQNPAHCYRDTGKYDVSLIITNLIDGCRNGSVEKQMIQIFPTPKAILSADAEICYEDTLRIEYLRAKPNSHARWSATGNKLLSDENARATYLLTNETSEVGFTVEEDGCTSEPFKVQLKRKPNFDFEVSETDICQPFPVTLKSSTMDPDLQFFWTVDLLKRVPGDSLVHLFNREGYYSVVLEAVSSLTGCSDTVTKEQFIHVYPLPVPEFKQNYKVATVEHPDISFTNESTGAVRYVWDFGDGTGSEEHHPQHTYTAIGEYRVSMKAYTDFGCTDTISSGVKIIPFTFYVPNAFRPDSDIAENQVFLPLSFREAVDPGKYALEVFNRVGSKVYETRNPESGWNGKSPNGTTYEPGIYVWVVEFTDIQGYNHLQKGTVMLVR